MKGLEPAQGCNHTPKRSGLNNPLSFFARVFPVRSVLINETDEILIVIENEKRRNYSNEKFENDAELSRCDDIAGSLDSIRRWPMRQLSGIWRR